MEEDKKTTEIIDKIIDEYNKLKEMVGKKEADEYLIGLLSKNN